MPRVVSGSFRGTILNAPKGDKTRPTTDKVKEALFSMIQGRLYDIAFLDLFSGSGQIGIEAVSRGAKEAVLVDKANDAISIIRQNLNKVHFIEERKNKGVYISDKLVNEDLSDSSDITTIRVLKESISQALTRLGEENRKFDIIFMDPPYKIAENALMEAASLIDKYDLLNEDGILIVEHANDTDLNKDVINLKFNRSCSYGLTVITFFGKV